MRKVLPRCVPPMRTDTRGLPRVERASKGGPRAGTVSPQRVRCGALLPYLHSRAGTSASYGALGAVQDASGHRVYWTLGAAEA